MNTTTVAEPEASRDDSPADQERRQDASLLQIRAQSLQVAVLVPCHNEVLSIKRVIEDFRRALPQALVFVYDNCSTDGTGAAARAAGAIVREEPWPGKGNVVRRMFADVEADIYILVDGDGTYDASAAPEMVKRLLTQRLDMFVATRANVYREAHRFGHGFGNRLFNRLYRELFGPLFTDIFSGYRVFSRRFVKSFPAVSSGFEIETEISVHASQLRVPIGEMPTPYGEREEGSLSKLSTFRDSLRILGTFLLLFKEVQPARFFGVIASILTATALILAYPLYRTYVATGLVPRFPTAILATGMVLLAGIAFTAGLILDSVARSRLEQKRMSYIALSQLRGRAQI